MSLAGNKIGTAPLAMQSRASRAGPGPRARGIHSRIVGSRVAVLATSTRADTGGFHYTIPQTSLFAIRRLASTPRLDGWRCRASENVTPGTA